MQFDKESLASMVREVWARNTPAPLRGGYVYAQIPIPEGVTFGDIPELEEACRVELRVQEDGSISLVFWKFVKVEETG